MAEKYMMYKEHFNEKIDSIKAGPVEERTFADKCCLGTFLVLFLATLGGGIYFIVAGSGFIE
jgi:hypothetical protein